MEVRETVTRSFMELELKVRTIREITRSTVCLHLFHNGTGHRELFSLLDLEMKL